MQIPRATITNGSQLHVCSYVAIDNIVLGLNHFDPGTTLNWTWVKPAGINSLVPTSLTGQTVGDFISGSFENTTDSPITITFQITPVGPMPTLCTGNTITATIRVNPVPRAVAVNNIRPEVCYGEATQVTLTSPSIMTSGTVRFDYTASATSGLVVGDLSGRNDRPKGDVISRTYQNNSNTLQSVYYYIIPEVDNNVCDPGLMVTSEVKIHPKPLQSLDQTTPLTCDGSAGLASLLATTAVGYRNIPFHMDWSGYICTSGCCSFK